MFFFCILHVLRSLYIYVSGADVNGSTPEGRTVLQIASSQGHGKVIDLLLEKGRIPNYKYGVLYRHNYMTNYHFIKCSTEPWTSDSSGSERKC